MSEKWTLCRRIKLSATARNVSGPAHVSNRKWRKLRILAHWSTLNSPSAGIPNWRRCGVHRSISAWYLANWKIHSDDKKKKAKPFQFKFYIFWKIFQQKKYIQIKMWDRNLEISVIDFLGRSWVLMPGFKKPPLFLKTAKISNYDIYSMILLVLFYLW